MSQSNEAWRRACIESQARSESRRADDALPWHLRHYVRLVLLVVAFWTALGLLLKAVT